MVHFHRIGWNNNSFRYLVDMNKKKIIEIRTQSLWFMFQILGVAATLYFAYNNNVFYTAFFILLVILFGYGAWMR